MDKALYIAMTGGKHIARAQTVHSNNMANANTLGFKADFAQARAQAVYYGDGLPTRVYAQAENPGTDLAHGGLIETGNELDIAIDGEGWIAVQGADGQEAYTRAGRLRIDAFGQLQTADGRNVLGDAGPLTIPPYEKVEIGSDGTITVRAQGEQPNALAELGRIKLVRLDGLPVTKGADGLIRVASVNGEVPAPVPADAAVRLQTGMVETSNVNAVDEFTQIISLARQFEMHMKMMKTVEENSASASQLLRLS